MAVVSVLVLGAWKATEKIPVYTLVNGSKSVQQYIPQILYLEMKFEFQISKVRILR